MAASQFGGKITNRNDNDITPFIPHKATYGLKLE
jgi:hypothetical protein